MFLYRFTVSEGLEYLEETENRFLTWLGLDELWPLVAALIAVAAILVFRRTLARLLLGIFFYSRRETAARRVVWHESLLKPFSWFLAALVLDIAVHLLDMSGSAGHFLLQIAGSFLSITIFWMIYRIVGLLFDEAALRAERRGNPLDRTALSYIRTAAKVLIIIVAALSVLSRWIANISGLIASVGIGGLVVALAAQDTASNLFASVAILLDKPFSIGDWIITEGISGSVEKVGLRSTHIRAADNTLISVPNAKLGNAIISNVTRRQTQLISFTLTLDASTPAEKAEKFLEETRLILQGIDKIEENGRMVRMDQLTNAGPGITIRYFTPSRYDDMMAVRESVNLAVFRLADRLGIRLSTSAVTLYYGDKETGQAGPDKKKGNEYEE